MKKTAIISSVILIIAVIAVAAVFTLSKFDNTSENVVSKDKTNVIIIIDENYLSNKNNVVQAKLVAENNNGFDINMFEVCYQDNDLYFNLNNDGVYTIEKDDTLVCNFTIEFNDKTENKDYLSLLENKSILINFNANAANQNDFVTQIKPKIAQGKIE